MWKSIKNFFKLGVKSTETQTEQPLQAKQTSSEEKKPQTKTKEVTSATNEQRIFEEKPQAQIQTNIKQKSSVIKDHSLPVIKQLKRNRK